MVEGMDATVVTVSGYCGIERMLLIKLISFSGANYVGRLSRSTTHLVCWKFKGKKYELAKKFKTVIINHQWLEDCIKDGKRIPEFPYTLRSGQEIGFNIHSLPAITETADILSENKLLLNRPNTHDFLNDVVDLVSDADEIENDDWDDDLLRDENVLSIPGSRKASQQMSKRKLDEETLRGDRRTNADARKANREPQKHTVDGVQCEVSDYSLRRSIKQRRNEHDTSNLPYAESSHSCRRLVKKFDKRNVDEISTIDAEQQSITCANVNELTFASSQSDDPNDLSLEIGASSSRRLKTMFGVQGNSRDNNNKNGLGPPSDSNLQCDDTSNVKGVNMGDITPDVRNLNGDKLGRDQSTIGASTELSCVICWTEFSSLRGVLPCGHRFCFSCIQNWADRMISNKKEPTCPLCKASYANITRVTAADSLDQKIYSQTIPCASSTQDVVFVSEVSAFHSDVQVTLSLVCCRCLSRAPEEDLLYCNTCGSGCIHHYCLDPPLFPWNCSGCRDLRLPFRS